MRYYIISDIHGNLEAFEAAIDAISKEGRGEYLCIGDAIGYGADPGECIRLVKSLNPKVLIAGNHEWGVLGLADLENFNEYARAALVWTKGVLNREEIDYLKSFRLVYEDQDFTLVHGSLEEPEKFYYILNGDDAFNTIKLMKTTLCFVGHSHVAGIFYYDNANVKYTEGPKIKIDYTKKYVVNVGSLGQPRDRDPRASFAIYDTDDNTVEIRRVEYDIETAQNKILAAGLPEILAARLSEGR